MSAAKLKLGIQGGGTDKGDRVTRNHNLVVANFTREATQQLKNRPCELYPGGMCLWLPAIGLYAYPDIVVVCGEPVFEDEHSSILINPTLIAEVYSEKTRLLDHNEKFKCYRVAGSLIEYILIAQDRCQVEQFTKQPNGGWLYRVEESLGGVLALDSVQCMLKLREVYDKVKL